MRINFLVGSNSNDGPSSKSWGLDERISKWESEPRVPILFTETFNDNTYATFFCGFGGSCSGAEAAGLKCVIALDNNDCDPRTGKERLPAIQTRERNIGDGRGVVLSIADFEPTRRHAARICFASPPCKRFSTAAETRDSEDAAQLAIDEDLKNLGVAAIEKAMQIPKLEFYCMENVEGLLSATSRPYLDKMISTLLAHGCSVEFSVYDARDFGLCQSRRRLFMVASRSGKKNLLPRSPGLKPAKFEQIVDFDADRKKKSAWQMTTYPTARAKEENRKGSVKWIVKNCDALGNDGRLTDRALALLDDCLPTVTCAWGGGATRKKVAILDDDIGGTGIAGLRHPTLLEGLRAQGFPDHWLNNLADLPDSLAWNMVGNAVPTPFSFAFAKHLQLPDEARRASSQAPRETYQPSSNMTLAA